MSGPEHPPGTPHGEIGAAHLVSVFCRCGHRWDPTPAGYRCTVVGVAHPDIPVRDVGAIPDHPCQPVTAFDPAEHPNHGPAAVEQVRREIAQEGT